MVSRSNFGELMLMLSGCLDQAIQDKLMSQKAEDKHLFSSSFQRHNEGAQRDSVVLSLSEPLYLMALRKK